METGSGNSDSHPEVQHFMRIPWCAKHLAAAATAAAEHHNHVGGASSSPLIVKVHENRDVLPTGGNQFVGGTLNTPGTIAAWVNFYYYYHDHHRRPSSPSPAQQQQQFRIDQFLSLLTLREGLIGFPHALHGGAAAVLLDEVTGMHIASQRDPEAPLNKDFLTASLKTTYLKPVPVPGTVLVRSRVVRVDGRKNYIEAQIEDEHGDALIKGEVLYIAVKSKI